MTPGRSFLAALILGVASPAVTCLAPPAAAQVVVHDPANHAENLLAAARMLEQIEHQIAALEQQARMLSRNPLQLSPELGRTLNEAEALFRRGEGLSHDIARIGGEIEALYPQTWAAYDLDGVIDQSARWRAESRESLTRAMTAQAQAAARLGDMQVHLDAALAASASAEGQTSAVQAGNQLAGLTADLRARQEDRSGRDAGNSPRWSLPRRRPSPVRPR